MVNKNLVLNEEENSFLEAGVILNSKETFFHNLLAGELGALPQLPFIIRTSRLRLSFRGQDIFFVFEAREKDYTRIIKLAVWRTARKIAMESCSQKEGKILDWQYDVFDFEDEQR